MANETDSISAFQTANTLLSKIIQTLAAGLPPSTITYPLSTTLGGTGSAVGPVLPGYLNGMLLANDSGTPNTILDIATGYATDSTNAAAIKLTSAFTKSTGGTWVVGSGSNGMGNGLTIANTTWYHVFAIISAGLADVYFDTSVTAGNAPVGTTAFRRIGSFLTDGAAHIKTFTQFGNQFLWLAPIQDVNAQAIATTALTPTLSIPLGVRTYPIISSWAIKAASAVNMAVSSPDTTSAALSNGNLTHLQGLAGAGDANKTVMQGNSLRSNLLSQIRFITDTAASTYNVSTFGWVDDLGRS